MIIPKNTKFRVSFRNKFTQNELKPLKQKQGQRNNTLINSHSLGFNNSSQLYYMRAVLPYFKPKAQALVEQEFNPVSSKLSYASNACLLFGNYGIIFETQGQLSAKLVTTMRNNISQLLKKRGKVWLRLCCDTPVTARPIETRMGKGKGSVSYWAGRIRPGQVYFEFEGLNDSKANQMFRILQKKSPYALRLISPKN